MINLSANAKNRSSPISHLTFFIEAVELHRMAKVTESGSVRFVVHVKPNASRIAVERSGGNLTIKLTASPQKGLANRQLLEIIAKELKIAKSCINVVSGHKSRNKLIEIAGITEKQLNAWRIKI